MFYFEAMDAGVLPAFHRNPDSEPIVRLRCADRPYGSLQHGSVIGLEGDGKGGGEVTLSDIHAIELAMPAAFDRTPVQISQCLTHLASHTRITAGGAYTD
jgi:hypothetical protein